MQDRVTHRAIAGRMALATSSLLLVALVSQAEAFTYHWELDETPQGSDRVSQVRPVQVPAVRSTPGDCSATAPLCN